MAKAGSKAWIVPLVIGCLVSVAGLVMLITGIIMDVPSMGESGWFDAESRRSTFIFVGIFMTIVGLSVGGAVSRVVYEMNPENRAKTVAKQKQNQQRFYDALRAQGVDPKTVEDEDNEYGLADLIKDKVAESRPVYCKYCGTKNDPGAKKCSSCGAGLSSKK